MTCDARTGRCRLATFEHPKPPDRPPHRRVRIPRPASTGATLGRLGCFRRRSGCWSFPVDSTQSASQRPALPDTLIQIQDAPGFLGRGLSIQLRWRQGRIASPTPPPDRGLPNRGHQPPPNRLRSAILKRDRGRSNSQASDLDDGLGGESEAVGLAGALPGVLRCGVRRSVYATTRSGPTYPIVPRCPCSPIPRRRKGQSWPGPHRYTMMYIVGPLLRESLFPPRQGKRALPWHRTLPLLGKNPTAQCSD